MRKVLKIGEGIIEAVQSYEDQPGKIMDFYDGRKKIMSIDLKKKLVMIDPLTQEKSAIPIHYHFETSLATKGDGEISIFFT